MDDSSGKRPLKRPRLQQQENVAEQDREVEEVLVDFFDNQDDDNNDNEEDRARLRRLQRRQRWKQWSGSEHEGETLARNVENRQDFKMEEEIQGEQEAAVDSLKKDDIADARKVDNDDDKEDGFDMFSSSVSPVVVKEAVTNTAARKNRHEEDVDDDEGYYKAVIGEMIRLDHDVSFKVLGTVGKGVFSTVLKCNTLNTDEPVAIKCVRNNETMAKAAETEIQILQSLQSHPHIVPLLFPTAQHPVAEHRGHKLLVFEYHGYNLRDVLQKFGKGVGLSLVSVKMYFGQLLSALYHLQRHSIIHADLKPDNMLVSDDFATLKICDFGSAMNMTESGNAIPTPYMVSRFYRAPEIILGYVPSYAMDLWSVAVTVAELFLGRVLFDGTSNNDMLKKIMETLGPLPHKQIKQHLLACKTYPLPRHFSEHSFLQQAMDPVTGQAVQKNVSLQTFPTRSLQSLLLKAKSTKDSRLQVQQLADLLKKSCALDPTRRISLKEALQHDVFKTSISGGNREKS